MNITDDGYTRPGDGLISVGWMGKLHSRAYQAVPQVYPELKIRPRLVHAADTAADRADYAREILEYASASTDYRDVLADPDVDVVSICAPNMLHREIGVAAARAGKPFWIEKPVGRDAGETAEVAAAARAAGSAASPTCARCSSTATRPSPMAPCPGGSSARRPEPARSAICSATSST